MKKLLFLSLLIPAICYGATYYVSPSGNDDTGDGSSGSPWKTLTTAFAQGGGNTYILQDGTYNYSGSEITGVPNGSSGSYTIIKSANDGGSVITQTSGLNLDTSDRYIQVEGVKFNYSAPKVILGQYIKILRCSFVGGASSGNSANVQIGALNETTQYILLEDCFSYGSGGRYNFMAYSCDYVILRRCVARHDGGWSGSSDPEAGFSIYNCTNTLVQNCISIDCNLDTYATWYANFYLIDNSATEHISQNNKFEGCVALVGHNMALTVNIDRPSTGMVIQDFVGWDCINGGVSGGGSGGGTVDFNRLTLGRSKLSSSGDFQGGMGAWGTPTWTITNAILTDWSAGSDLNGVGATYFDTHGCLYTANGTGRQTYDPLTNGLLYLTRIEDASNLKSNGTSGGQIGAEIVYKIGTDGTLYGETGYDTITANVLWPFPYESRIKSEMDDVSTRGFCADGETLTHYIMNYLGNGDPYDVPAASSHSPITGRMTFTGRGSAQ